MCDDCQVISMILFFTPHIAGYIRSASTLSSRTGQNGAFLAIMVVENKP